MSFVIFFGIFYNDLKSIKVIPIRWQLLFALFLYLVHPTAVAHSDVRVVTAQHYLTALCYYIAL